MARDMVLFVAGEQIDWRFPPRVKELLKRHEEEIAANAAKAKQQKQKDRKA